MTIGENRLEKGVKGSRLKCKPQTLGQPVKTRWMQCQVDNETITVPTDNIHTDIEGADEDWKITSSRAGPTSFSVRPGVNNSEGRLEVSSGACYETNDHADKDTFCVLNVEVE